MSTEPIFDCLAGELETSPQIKTPPITKIQAEKWTTGNQKR